MSMPEPTTPEPTTPEPILKGRFNMWETPDGGFHIAYVADGTDETQHIEVPGMAVNVARLVQDGKLNPFQAFKKIMSHEPA